MFFNIQKYFALGRINIKELMIYRFEFMFSIIISPIFLLLNFFIWSAIFSNNTGQTILGYGFNEIILYYVISMVLNHAIYSNVGVDLQESIIDGSLVSTLLKPSTPFSFFFMREVASRSIAFVLEVIPVFIISYFLFQFDLPSKLVIILFLLAIVLSFIINFMIGICIGLIAFWMNNVESLQWLGFIVVRLFSGEFIPLEFFGASFMSLSAFLPFQFLRFLVIKLFIFNSPIFALRVIAGQLIWILVLAIIFNIGWNRAMKSFGAVGG